MVELLMLFEIGVSMGVGIVWIISAFRFRTEVLLSSDPQISGFIF